MPKVEQAVVGKAKAPCFSKIGYISHIVASIILDLDIVFDSG